MKSLKPAHLAGLAVGFTLLLAIVMWGPGLCTVPKKERAPGPVVVWMTAEPEAEDNFREFTRRFQDATGLGVQLEFKEPWTLRPPYLTPEVLAGVDVIETDLFDLEATAPLVQDLAPFVFAEGDFETFYAAATQAGDFNEKRLFIPWRIAWPAVVKANNFAPGTKTWNQIGRIMPGVPGQFLVPSLNDRELLAFTCDLIWGYGGDPGDPDGEGFFQAMEWLEQARDRLEPRSDVSRAQDVIAMDPAKRPTMFLAWPEQVVPLVLEATIPMSYEAEPLPCGQTSCGVFFFGRFLAVPQNAPHPDDAYRFIAHFISREIQTDMVYATPWLPVRTNAWTDLGVRAEAYQAFSLRGPNLRITPKNLARLEKALPKAARMILFEKSSIYRAIEAYSTIMAGNQVEENQ